MAKISFLDAARRTGYTDIQEWNRCCHDLKWKPLDHSHRGYCPVANRFCPFLYWMSPEPVYEEKRSMRDFLKTKPGMIIAVFVVLVIIALIAEYAG